MAKRLPNLSLALVLAARVFAGFFAIHSAAAFVPAPPTSWSANGELLRLSASSDTGRETDPSLSSRRNWLGRAASASLAAGGWTIRPQPSSSATLTKPETDLPPSTLQSPSLCDPSVSTWRNPTTGRIVHVIGTAHVSEDSAKLAGNVVREVKPDAVFVELDRKRVARALPPGEYRSEADVAGLADGPAGQPSDGSGQQQLPPRSRNPFALREKMMQAGSQLVGDAIKGMYKKLESDGFNAGEEFVVAIREGLAVNSAIVLGDRDVEVTLRRLTEALSKTDLKKLLASDSELEKSLDSLMPSGGGKGTGAGAGPSSSEMSKDQFRQFVETVKARENVRLVMSQLKQAAPEIYSAMVGERDEYMARGLATLDQFGTMVAVMGIAHVDGVEENLRDRGWVSVSVSCQPRQ